MNQQLHFAPFCLELANERLWRGAQVVFLRPKSYLLLLYLAEHPNRLIPHAEFMEALWHHHHLSDGLLRSYIKELRRALGDKAEAPRFIETANGRGYRFLAAVTRSPADARALAIADSPLPRQTTGGSCFVGREDEPAWLHQRLSHALEGRRQLVWISGEPGIGKTAIAERFDLCADLPLRRLTQDEVADYVALRFALEPRCAAVSAWARLLHERTDGVPLFLAAVVDELGDRLPPQPDAAGGLHLLDALDGTSIPVNLFDLFERHIERLAVEEQQVPMRKGLRVFELWIEYLLEADPATWTEQVRADFDGCPTAPPFAQWIFKANDERGLFFDSAKVVPAVIELEQAEGLIPGRQITVVIDITASDDEIAAGAIACAQLHRDVVGWTRPPGRPKFEAEPAKYRLASHPDVQALEITLAAHRLIKANPDKHLWELGYDMIRSHGVAPRWRNEGDGPDKRKELSNIMSSYKTRAAALIDCAAKGVFPAP